MGRGLLERVPARPGPVVTSPPALRLLDRALDRELTRACALVGRASGARAQVILSTGVGELPVALLWAACDARAAELCDRYGVELLLVEEGGQIRIRIDRYRALDPRPTRWSRWRGWWHRHGPGGPTRAA